MFSQEKQIDTRLPDQKHNTESAHNAPEKKIYNCWGHLNETYIIGEHVKRLTMPMTWPAVRPVGPTSV